jgi:hypothetical protein
MPLTNAEIQSTITQHLAQYTKHDLSSLSPEELAMFEEVNYGAFVRSVISTGRWLEKKAEVTERPKEWHAPSRISILKSIANSIRWGKEKNKERTLKYASKFVKPAAPVLTKSMELREVFQDTCTDGSWCITGEESEGLLKKYDFETLRTAFSELNNKLFSENDAQQCMDLLRWKLETRN